MFTIAAIVVVLLIAGVLGLAASKPATFRVERSHEHSGYAGKDFSAD